MRYKIPDIYYYRLHHPRPRFKSNIENVLGYMAFSIAELDKFSEEVFVERLLDAIHNFRGNENLTKKTLNNWRTEISAIFSMILVEDNHIQATDITKRLADTSNLREFFLRIILTFQYPAGFLKSHEIKKIVNAGILFHPLLWISKFFTSNIPTEDRYLTDVEFCHCALNDLRVSRDHEDISITISRIMKNRSDNLMYDVTGDVKRYALDLLDYCALAGLLIKDYSGKYFPRNESLDFLSFFSENAHQFQEYKQDLSLFDIEQKKSDWIKYVNNISSQIINDFECLITSSHQVINENIIFGTKDIGDKGEALTIAHEKIWLLNNDRKDLSKLVQHIPTQFAVGYDVLSRELDATMKHIEVKTTISQKDFTVKRIHLTPNEWSAAESFRERYYIYRIQLSEESLRLWVIQNPVELYKKDMLKMVPRNGADLFFDENCYSEIELLTYHE